MPIYLCNKGSNQDEPWKHTIDVYAEIFDIGGSNDDDDDGDPSFPTAPSLVTNNNNNTIHSGELQLEHHLQSGRTTNDDETAAAHENDSTGAVVTKKKHSRKASKASKNNNNNHNGKVMRRIRHAEVVLVDDVCTKFGHCWLRLRWPGSNGGFAGYVCLGPTVSCYPATPDDVSCRPVTTPSSSATVLVPNNMNNNNLLEPNSVPTVRISATSLMRATAPPDPSEPAESPVPVSDAPQALMDAQPSPPPSSGLFAASSSGQSLRCLRTGLAFPSNPSTLKLLPSYDDGLDPPVAIPSDGNPVFCRICREGLHEDDADDDQEGEKDKKKGENPLLAPCECIGSMAFVHYLCVEQWRCRSRHREARQGLNCETCSKPYALPPPASRPRPSQNQQANLMEEDMLDGIPPHVVAALREPHLWWRIGAFLVRRRWLRPIAPILLSPLVSLYCRARRLLKKRGVSRRRWACSLCRRRARWKCVRCLRSYYCSRHCQNVSWHIVHKHVCYKPTRFWWSVVVYGTLLLVGVPGILRDAMVFDLMIFLVPASFYITAILGGGLATLLKRTGGVDMRGRMLETAVVLATLWLVWISQGLAWAFFGETDSCVGMMGAATTPPAVSKLTRAVTEATKRYFVFWDNALLVNTLVARIVCPSRDMQEEEQQCFDHVPMEDPMSILTEHPKCANDFRLVSWLWVAAGATLFVSTMWKKRRRQNRVHQD